MKILLIDDDRKRMGPFIETLRLTHEVNYLFDANDIFPFLNDKSNEIDLIILDIMMSIGNLKENFKDEDNEKETGIFIFKLLKKKFPKIPVIIFSVVKDDEIKKIFNDTLFIEKPKTVDEFIMLVDDFQNKRRK